MLRADRSVIACCSLHPAGRLQHHRRRSAATGARALAEPPLSTRSRATSKRWTAAAAAAAVSCLSAPQQPLCFTAEQSLQGGHFPEARGAPLAADLSFSLHARQPKRFLACCRTLAGRLLLSSLVIAHHPIEACASVSNRMYEPHMPCRCPPPLRIPPSPSCPATTHRYLLLPPCACRACSRPACPLSATTFPCFHPSFITNPVIVAEPLAGVRTPLPMRRCADPRCR